MHILTANIMDLDTLSLDDIIRLRNQIAKKLPIVNRSYFRNFMSRDDRI